MRLIVYDTEVFCEDWLVVLKDMETGKYTAVHNDNEELKQYIAEDNIYVGFNSKHYDQFIIKAICCGFTPQEVKQTNDYLIGGGQGWEYPPLRDFFFKFNNVDIKDDMQMGLSLKVIEGHLGLSVEESTVPFDIDRALTEDELKETAKYCMHDVDTTERLVELRRDYLKTKINLGTALSYSGATRWNDSHITREGLDTGNNPHVMLPSTTGTGTESTDYCDNCWGNTGWKAFQHGGAWNDGSSCGLFAADLGYSAGGYSTRIGSRLLYIPS